MIRFWELQSQYGPPSLVDRLKKRLLKIGIETYFVTIAHHSYYTDCNLDIEVEGAP